MSAASSRTVLLNRSELMGGCWLSSMWWSLQWGVGLHHPAATSSSFGLSKRRSGAVFFPTQQAPLASLWLLGRNPGSQGVWGPN